MPRKSTRTLSLPLESIEQPPERRQYRPTGRLALDPRAFFMFFDDVDAPETEMVDGVAVVGVRGPLSQHPSWWMDSYEDIAARVQAALDGGAQAIVMSIASPGGDLAGCLDTARALKAMTAEAEVPLVAFADGLTASAGYALACVADHLVVSGTSEVGSIGVIEAIYDNTAMHAELGVKVSIIASGARKADYWPEQVTTAEAEAAAQQRIDELAEQFFELVADHRPVLSVDAVRALEASLFVGGTAVELGLADEVGTLATAIARALGEERQEEPERSAAPGRSPGGGPSASKRGMAMASEATPPDPEETPDPDAATPAGEEALQVLQQGLGLDDEEAVLQWAREFVAQQGAGDGADQAAAAAVTAITNLAGRVAALEGTVKPMASERIERQVDDVIRAGKATPSEKPALVALAQQSPQLFKQLTGSRVAMPGAVTDSPSPEGSSGPPNVKDEIARLTGKQAFAFSQAKGRKMSDADALAWARGVN